MIALDDFKQLTTQLCGEESWDTNRCRASKETLNTLWNPDVQYLLQRRTPPVPILRQINPIRALTSHFFKTHFNITLPSTPRSSKWSSFLQFPHQYPLRIPPLTTCPIFPVIFQAWLFVGTFKRRRNGLSRKRRRFISQINLFLGKLYRNRCLMWGW
jgi:hypothetical protein